MTTPTRRSPAGLRIPANSSGQSVVPYCTKTASSSSMPSAARSPGIPVTGSPAPSSASTRWITVSWAIRRIQKRHTLIGLIPGEYVVLGTAGVELRAQRGVAAIEQLQRGLVVQARGWPRVRVAAQPHALDLVRGRPRPRAGADRPSSTPGSWDPRAGIGAGGHVAEPPEISLEAITQTLALHALTLAHAPDNPGARPAAANPAASSQGPGRAPRAV